MDLLRIRNPAAFQLPSILAFVREALSFHTVIPSIDEAILELAFEAEKPGVAVFLLRDKGQFVGFALCQWSPSKLNPVCVCAHFYNKGSHEARKTLVKACVDFAREGGYKRLIGVDMNQRPRAFAKVFADAGRATYVGEVYAFEIGSGSE